jgi:hypothetical protein
VSGLSTKNLSLVEHECVKNKCDDFFLYVSAIYLAIYVEDIEAITDNSELQDFILILGDFNLPKVKWKVDEKSGSMMPLNVTSDLESDVIGGVFGCDLKQINERPNEKSTFLDLVFANVSVDMAVEGAEAGSSPQGLRNRYSDLLL